MRALALSDALLIAILAYALARQNWMVVVVLAPTRAVVYVLLMVTLVWAARRWWWGWDFVAWCAVMGPVASVPGLLSCRRAGR